MKLWLHSHKPYRYREGGDKKFCRGGGANSKKKFRKDKKDKKPPHMVRKVPQKKEPKKAPT